MAPPEIVEITTADGVLTTRMADARKL